MRGGAALTNRQELAEKMRLYANHGITGNIDWMDQPPDGDWYYQQIELGYNYRLSDIHAALGLSQLKRLDQFIQKRTDVANIYNQAFKSLPLDLPLFFDDRSSAFHLYQVLVRDNAGVSRKELFNHLRNSGITAHVHYIPVHTQPYYRKMGYQKGDFPNAENFYEHVVTLPCFPDLSDFNQQHIIKILTSILS